MSRACKLSLDPGTHRVGSRAHIARCRIDEVDHRLSAALHEPSVERDMFFHAFCCTPPGRTSTQSFTQHVRVADEREITDGREVAPLDPTFDVVGHTEPCTE